jgi:hypothetical protein
MKKTTSLFLACLYLGVGASGCSDDPTTAIVENGFSPAADGGSNGKTTVFKVWWSTTLFASPIAPLTRSEVERTVPATDFAYALLALGWIPEDAAPPSRLVPVRSASRMTVAAHDLLRIVVSDETFTGDCATGKPLSAEDAQFIVERIFPGDFAGGVYDPATCETTSADGGAADGAAIDAQAIEAASDASSDR